MPAAGRTAMLLSMTARLTIEWERRLTPVAGHVTVGTAAPQPFSGWLELLGLLRAAVGADDDNAPATTLEEEP